jgi:hypothetical protein
MTRSSCAASTQIDEARDRWRLQDRVDVFPRGIPE